MTMNFYASRVSRSIGPHENITFEVKIHPNLNANAIVINYPGYKGSVDGYSGKYSTLAEVITAENIGAVVRMGNHEWPGIRYERSLVDDLKAVIGYSIENAPYICGSAQPDIYLMGFSAGAGAVAVVASDYPSVKKILLVAPSGDVGEHDLRRKFPEFRGEVAITIGENDEVVGISAGERFLTLARGAKNAILRIVPQCDHQFRGKTNGMVLSRAPLWAFTQNAQDYPSPDEGLVLYR